MEWKIGFPRAFLCLTRLIGFLHMRRCICYYCSCHRSGLPSSSGSNYFCISHVFLFLVWIWWYGNMLMGILLLIKRIDRFGMQQRLWPSIPFACFCLQCSRVYYMRMCIHCLLLSTIGNGKEDESVAIWILSAGPFVIDISRAGSSVVLFVLIVLTPVCQFHPLAASLCCCWHSREYIN